LFGFETRLGNPDPVCDFFMLIGRDEKAALFLGGKSPGNGFPADLRANPVWEKITRLFASWCSPVNNRLSRHISSVWLEFDYSGDAFEPVPNIFFKFAGNPGAQTFIEVYDEIYAVLFGIPFPAKTAEKLRTCVENLPPGAVLKQFGLMVPRKTDTVRLLLTGIGAGDIVKYLQSSGWEGETATLQDYTAKYATMCDFFLWNLNVGDKIFPYLACELQMSGKPQPGYSGRWKIIFDDMVASGLALPAKCEALLRFTGARTVDLIYPVRYLNGISHVKLVFEGGRPAECKGYFGVLMPWQKMSATRPPQVKDEPSLNH
jgi:hypothetical protein